MKSLAIKTIAAFGASTFTATAFAASCCVAGAVCCMDLLPCCW